MRVTRAAVRAGIVHEDEEIPPLQTATSLEVPQTPKDALRDITSKNIILTPGPAHKTPKFDPEVHQEVKDTPEDAGSSGNCTEDSFVEHIIARSPAKPARIEDSVDAMDALEDAIEQVSQNLPMIEELDIQSASKSHKAPPLPRTATKSPGKLSPKKQSASPRKASPRQDAPTPRKISPAKTSLAARKSPPIQKDKVSATPSKAPGALKSTSNSSKRHLAAPKVAAGRPSMTSTVKRPSPIAQATTKPAGAKMNSPAKSGPSIGRRAAVPAPNTTERRKTSASLSTSKPGFLPAKSSKPTTMSTFSLPGEAVAARLKAQREERQKREEEVAQRQKESKSKAVPPKQSKAVPQPRATKTSLARLSMMGKHTIAAKPVPTAAKANSTLSIPKARGPVPANAKSSVRRTTIIPSGTTIAPPPEKMVSVEELRARAKRAREEAAEKGRLASREWAEKQKKRSLQAASTKAQTAQETPVESIAV